MTRSLRGTAAMVTGASSGIGAATARELATHGAAVSLVARRRDRLDRLVDRITADGGTALVVISDVSDRNQAQDAVERSVRQWGRLDILVNNAGITRPAPALQARISDWEDMVQLNLTGSLYCLHAALPHLVEAGDTEPRRVADLINISSLVGPDLPQGVSGVLRHETCDERIQRITAPRAGRAPGARDGARTRRS
jgi:NADP-dependent 3-hydroxy acid dehydrogenase YdfG